MKTSTSKLIILFIGGSLVLLVGGILGTLIGMTIGGNVDPPFYYGGLPGYEGAGLLGSILGASLATKLWIDHRLSDSMQRKGTILLLLATVITLLIQDRVARHTGVGILWVIFLPIISQILLFVWYKPKDFS
mgnify:FL=1